MGAGEGGCKLVSDRIATHKIAEVAFVEGFYSTMISDAFVVKLGDITLELSRRMPSVLRWAGSMARQLRSFDTNISGHKTSGQATTDALTWVDLAVQELLMAALRDSDPVLRTCRIEAEESIGDLQYFASESDYTIVLDPIDGTRQYQGQGNGWSVLISLRSAAAVHYSLVYIPQSGAHGTWVEALGDRVVCGADDLNRSATEVLRSLRPLSPNPRPEAATVYLGGFDRSPQRIRQLEESGIVGCRERQLPGCMFELLARNKMSGMLINTPNIYDFTVMVHLVRSLGGEALWVHNRQPVIFQNLWLDERASVLRLPGTVACSVNRETLAKLCEIAGGWNLARYGPRK